MIIAYKLLIGGMDAKFKFHIFVSNQILGLTLLFSILFHSYWLLRRIIQEIRGNKDSSADKCDEVMIISSTQLVLRFQSELKLPIFEPYSSTQIAPKSSACSDMTIRYSGVAGIGGMLLNFFSCQY